MSTKYLAPLPSSQYGNLRNLAQLGAQSPTSLWETDMGSTENDLATLDSIAAVAGAVGAIIGGIAGFAGLARILGTGTGS